MTGRVVSIKMQNTAVVLITRTAVHPLYNKTYVQSKKYLAQDDLGVKLGDIVEMVKIKPVSKKKHWKITKVVGRSLEEIVSEQLQEKAAQEVAEVMPEEKEVEASDEVENAVITSDEKKEGGKSKSKIKGQKSKMQVKS